MTTGFDLARFRSLTAGDHPGLGEPSVFTELTDSTNDDAFAAAARGASDGALFVTGVQRAGRGRRGSSWLSEPNEGLLFSVLLRRPFGADTAALISLVTGLAVRSAVADTLTDHGVPKGVSVKWPNDVLVDARKLAGILVETRARGAEAPVTVIGVGLNLGRLNLPADVETRAVSLEQLGVRPVNRERLLHRILTALATRLGTSTLGEHGVQRATGRASAIDELRRYDALRGREIAVEGIVGTGLGIDDAGHLLIRDEAGAIHAVRSGHVVMK